ncbi:hypothetical protein HG535_0D00730 [Zygotorulaspora mrakii]|uniref:RNA helicase n=1 Tax=Zygotorulaspora mrakii TaxID=42260 RepID=A0A7H9B1R3_ZYGMR|nr:uncharacterized protein HG535_0D00730 [Zygotorulaspora mrakii]QLG72366.1 hypothetical protein HG535_0D00730 [Zygotorulaspora mrakii]
MGTYRKRFNEKARAGQVAKQKILKRIRNKQFLRHAEDYDDSKVEEVENAKDTNAELLNPMTEEEKKVKKRKLQELFAPKESKISRLKKKRLDKFVEHQLDREEKKAILEKLQEYKVDTSLMTSLKNLGHGRQTKKQEFQEALSLEKQGRSDNRIQEILYEKVQQRDWNRENERMSSQSDETDNEEDGWDTADKNKSSFIDLRPVKNGGTGFGFGFANAKVVTRKVPKRKYNWKQRVELQERRKQDAGDEMDFLSSTDEAESLSSNESVTNEADKNTSEAESQYIENSDSSEDNEVDDSEDEASEEDKEEVSQVSIAADFKEWANKEIKKIEGTNKEYVMPPLKTLLQPVIREEDLDDGLIETQVPIDENSQRKAFFVDVKRPEEVNSVRMQLPVFGEEHKIMEAIHHNDVVIICGATGSGKTTQVPQFLYESGFGSENSPDYPGMIGITQPRRVAAVSMAKRVSIEMGDHGDKVAHQIRFDSNTGDSTRIKFMTDGVLLREMMKDFKLTNYSSIIIDEAHERNINTDILIGMLSRCVRLRAKEHAKDLKSHKKLKLIIMSATLRVSDFSENTALFPVVPPVLNVEARQYPVSIHFNRKTNYDYMEEAFKKTCKIHRKLPPGTILVFLTGQQEITQMVKKLRQEFPSQKGLKANRDLSSSVAVKVNSKNADIEAEDIDFSVKVMEKDNFDDGSISDGDDNSSEEEGFEEAVDQIQQKIGPLHVLPLYSLLPTNEQMKVFQEAPAGSRLCIVATNVAETSLTIPGVKYVVDCGRCKERKFNEVNGVQSFEIDWISKASADQRSGRAGRTGPGHCYRLYSSALFERDFKQFSRPEILRMPVESVVLQMKSMAIHNVLNFPFPTPPDRKALSTAIQLLQYLGSLDADEKITEDGKIMSLFPLSPRFSKLLLVSEEGGCLSYAVSIVSALSVGDPFIKEQELGIGNQPNHEEKLDEVDHSLSYAEKERQKVLRTKYYKSKAQFCKLDQFSDVFRLLSVVNAFDYIPEDQKGKFLHDNFLRGKFMEEITKLRKQLMYIIKSNTSKENVAVVIRDEDLKSKVPSETQLKLLKQMVCAGFVDQVAIRADCLFPEETTTINKTSIINIPYIPVLTLKTPEVSDCFVYIHPNSLLANIGEIPPKFLVYHSLHQNNSGKTRLNALCDIKSTPLANIARKGSLLTYSKPLNGQGLKIIPLTPTERYCYVVPRFGATLDGDLKVGWDLNPIPVHQEKVNGQWQVTKFILSKTYKSAEKDRRR